MLWLNFIINILIICVSLFFISKLYYKLKNEKSNKNKKRPIGETRKRTAKYLILIILLSTIILVYLYLSGVDYFLMRICILLLLPILYCIAKLIYRCIIKKGVQENPYAKRIKIGSRDIIQVGAYYLSFGVISGIGHWWFLWFEEEEFAGYWLSPFDVEADEWALQEIEEFGYNNIQIADYKNSHLTGEASLHAGEANPGDFWIPGYYESEYREGLFSNFYSMLDAVLFIGIGAGIAGIILLIAGKALKKSKI